MPRRSRMYVPGMPFHVVQRGNNRQACFLDSADREVYLDLWRNMSRRYRVAVHAFCLMTNHVHFLVTPDDDTAVSNTMKVIGSRYAQYVNKRYGRTGTLWEGRHRSSMVHSERYLLTCMRYIELNPVRASMVAHPKHYPWSSYVANAWGGATWIRPTAEYLSLGTTDEARLNAYRELFQVQLCEQEIETIRKAAHYCQPIGDDRFRAWVVEQYGVPVGHLARGRPRAHDGLPKK